MIDFKINELGLKHNIEKAREKEEYLNQNNAIKEEIESIQREISQSEMSGEELTKVIEENTAAAIRENKERISAVSAERIRVELTKLLCGANVKNVLMDWWDVLGVVIPDITFQLAKERKPMALFSPYDVERVMGMPFADVDITAHYDEMLADELKRRGYILQAVKINIKRI